MSDDVRFSRSGRTSLFGKRTLPVHSKISEETAEGLRRLAHEAGLNSVSEFLAVLIETRVHGEDMVRSVMEQRIAVVSGKAPAGRGNG